MNIDLDFRLLEVSLELGTLEDQLELIEKHIAHRQKLEKLRLQTEIKKRKLNSDDPEWHDAYQTYYDKIGFLLPRFLRNPFLVSLYAVYEAAVIEIAQLIPKKKDLALSLDDIRGNDFLDRSKKYYKHIILFDLYKDNSDWQQIKMLSELRNAIAHTNGRIEMLKEKTRDKIRIWEKSRIGVEDHYGYIVLDGDFLNKIFSLVKSSLHDLLDRYKEWDKSYDGKSG